MEHMGIVSFQVPVSIVLWYFDDFDVLVPNNGNWTQKKYAYHLMLFFPLFEYVEGNWVRPSDRIR